MKKKILLPVSFLILCALVSPSLHAHQAVGLMTATATQSQQGPPVATLKCDPPIAVPAGVGLNAYCRPFISNIKKLLDSCPASDPVYAQIRKDFQIRRNGKVVIEVACAEPVSKMPLSKYSDELIVLQALRAIYYMDRGKPPSHLPWVTGTLYDWLRSKVRGFNIDDRAVNDFCCTQFDGKDFITLTSLKNDDLNREYKRRWLGIALTISLFAHERRHLDGFSHVTCKGSNNMDQSFDEKNLSPFGVQWWLIKSWLLGEVRVGFACLPAAEQNEAADLFVSALEGYRTGRFCGAAPPVVTKPKPAGTCLDPVNKLGRAPVTPSRN